MNKVLADVYLHYRKQKWGKGIDGMSFEADCNLQEIIVGNVEQRDRQREKFLSDQFEKHLKKIISE